MMQNNLGTFSEYSLENARGNLSETDLCLSRPLSRDFVTSPTPILCAMGEIILEHLEKCLRCLSRFLLSRPSRF